MPTWLPLAISVLALALSCFNTWLCHRTTPARALKRLDALERMVELKLGQYDQESASRVAAFQTLKGEVQAVLESLDDVLDRIETRRRRIAASEARQRAANGSDDQVQTSPVADLDAARAVARERGLM